MTALAPADRAVIQLMVSRLALRSPRRVGRRVLVTDIIDQVAYETGVSRADIRGDRRFPALFRPRCAVCWLARRLSSASLPQIGDVLNRHHSSVLHACRCAAELRERDPAFRRLTDRLLRHFRDLQED